MEYPILFPILQIPQYTWTLFCYMWRAIGLNMKYSDDEWIQQYLKSP